MVDKGLFSAVAEDIVDLAVPGEHCSAECNQLRGKVVCVLSSGVYPLGSQTHHACIERQDAGCHKGVPGTIAAKVHPDMDTPWSAGLFCRP